jgi:hypothetical protein
MKRIRILLTDTSRACALFHVSRQQRPVFITFLLSDEIKRLAMCEFRALTLQTLGLSA